MQKSQPEGVCPFCGADKVRNPHTGKVFCSKKCWLRDKPPTESTQRPLNAPRTSGTGQDGIRYVLEPKHELEANLAKLQNQFNATFSKVQENQIKIVRKIEELERKQHALWATLIQNNLDLQEKYDFHLIPIITPQDVQS